MLRGNVSEQIFMDRRLWIYTPPSYKESWSAFPVVYVQDGCDLFCAGTNSLDTMEQWMSESKLKEVILVGIESAQRNDDYTPWPAPALTERFNDFGGKGDRYLSFIVHDLKPYIDAEYNTDSSFTGTAIMGASLGGLISIYAAYLYPQVFGAIGAISASFWYEGFMPFMDKADQYSPDQKIYMYVGTAEGIYKTNIQRHMVENTRKAFELLRTKKCSISHVKFATTEGAAHEDRYFVEQFPLALQWLFPA